ncbi:MAG: N-acetylmuramoyl-L-alanine amidase [Roseobacter sp.]
MTYLSDERVKYIVIHYSATPIEREYTYKMLERHHKERGFKEGGYHFYFPRKGGRIAGRDLTQPGMFEMGAHSKGENDESVGLCFEGGVTLSDPHTGRDTRNDAQLSAMIETIDDLLFRYPDAQVIGHRDMPGAATQCPGHDASAWWASVVAERQPVVDGFHIEAESKPHRSWFQKIFWPKQ